MIYIYDVEVNFNRELYSFYDWKETDNISLIRKIPLIKVCKEFYNNILKNSIKVDESFLSEIENKTQIYKDRRVGNLRYSCSFTNGEDIICVLFKSDGTINKISKLSIIDEMECLELVDALKEKRVLYELIEQKNKFNYYTRHQEVEIKKILEELYYIKEDKNKLNYLYYEWFNKDSITNNAYNELVSDIIKNFYNKKQELLNTIKILVEK